eukprot:jgi/Phyca11/533289/estExt2_fgenesh1_pg.C_PHYCAscaffold_120077
MCDQVKQLQVEGNALYSDGHYDAAHATQALKYNVDNEKAILRKLVALENLERFEAALQVVNNVLDNGEKKAPSVFQYCVGARRRLRKNLARDREVAASEVKQMGKMVHDKQQLRINFGCLLPSQVPLDQFFDVNCSLRNNTADKYKLVFQEPLDTSEVANAERADADGKLKLNDRGKASFRVAVVTVDGETLEVIPLLDYNVRLNFPEDVSSVKGVAAPVLPIARAHLWGEPPHDLPSQPDMLVLSDVVYDPEGYAPLVSSLKMLATSPDTLVLMAHRSRNPMEHQFFELLSQYFSCEQIDWLSTEKSAPKASPAGGPPSAEQALQDVKIFVIRRLARQ